MEAVVQVENIKCGGCANSIQKKLQQLTGVLAVEVHIEEGEVVLQCESEAALGAAKKALAQMGYPEVGTTEGLSALGAKAKSFVSCATGKLSDK